MQSHRHEAETVQRAENDSNAYLMVKREKEDGLKSPEAANGIGSRVDLRAF